MARTKKAELEIERLLWRGGYGPRPGEARRLAGKGRRAVVEELLPSATVVRTGRNGGYAAGINAGIAAAGPHDAVLVLNPDVRLTPGCAARLVRELETPRTGAAVPRLVDGDGRLIETIRREPSVPRSVADALVGASRVGRYRALAAFGEVVTDPRAYDLPQVVDWAEGSTLLLSGRCREVVGPWDESFFLYSEETDYALRLRDAGLAVRYVPEALAIHLEGDSRSAPALWALLTVNRVRLFRKRHGAVGTALYRAALLLREGSRAALGRPTNRAAVRALLDAARLRRAQSPADLLAGGAPSRSGREVSGAA